MRCARSSSFIAAIAAFALGLGACQFARGTSPATASDSSDDSPAAPPPDTQVLTEIPHSDADSGGLLSPCPVAAAQEGSSVAPRTRLHLTSAPPFDDAVYRWFQWSVDAPPGVVSRFFPSEVFSDPVYDVTILGDYTFHLTVTDADGNHCTSDLTVHVASPKALTIELLWHTPGDPDETDEGPIAGSDLDLHFVHPFAAGPDLDRDGAPDGYFDAVFDTFWDHRNPNWGSLDPSIDDNPMLERDDSDGAGPELIDLGVPENVCYRVGVHVFADRGMGPSDARVRIYLAGALALDTSNVRLANHDMWTVADICWPAQTSLALTRVCTDTTTACTSDADCAPATCGPRIAHDYVHPLYPTP